MKFFFLVLFLTIQLQTGFGQKKAELLQKLKTASPDSARLNSLLKISKLLLTFSGVQKSQIDSAHQFITEAVKLSKSLHDLNGQGQTYLLLSLYYNTIKDKPKGVKYSNAALSLFTKQGDLRNQAEAYIAIGQCYEDQGHAGLKKIAYYRKASDLFQRTNQIERMASTLVDIADLLSFQDSYEKIYSLEQIKTLRLAITLYNSIKYDQLYGVYDLLGSALRVYGDYVNSLKYELLAIKSYEANGEKTLQLCTIYNRTGQSYIRLNDNKTAIIYLLKSLKVAQDFKSEVSELIVKNNLVTAYTADGQHEKAIGVLKTMEGSPLIAGQVSFNTLIYGKFMTNYLAMKKFILAKTYFDKIQKVNQKDAVGYGRSIDYYIAYYLATRQYLLCYPYLKLNKKNGEVLKVLELNGDNELSWFKADSALGNLISAIRHYQRYKLLTDSSGSISRNRQIALFNVEYESEKKDLNILLQKKNIQFLQKEAQLTADKATANRNLLMGGLYASILLLGVGYNRFRLKQKTNKQLKLQQVEIEKQKTDLEQLLTEKESLLSDKDTLLTEKDWLLKEVHHRVKNNLQIVMSLLSSQSAYLKNTAALDAIRESQNRVQAISLIHQKLYNSNNVAYIVMQAYVSDLVGYLTDCFGTKGRGIRIEQLVEDISLDLAQVVPLGLILNEAITNAIKYAFDHSGGEIIIALQQVGQEGLMLHISDNGKGLPHDFDLRKASSLGMEMMKALSKQLGGEFKVRNKSGLHISVEFLIERVPKHSTAQRLK